MGKKIDNAVMEAKQLRLIRGNLPVDVEWWTKYYGITLLYRDIGKCSGFYMPCKNGNYIVINSTEPEFRQRYTLGHEIYHHLHPASHKNDSMIVEYYSENEKAANSFSAELLMPEDAVRLHLPQFLVGDWNDIKLAMANFFNVSKEAALFRLEELKIIENTSVQYLQQLKEAYKAVKGMEISESSRLTAAAQIADFINM